MTHMTDLMHYAFIDESGTVGAPGRTHYLVVAVLIAGRARDIEMPVRRALKKFGRSLRRGEIKAANFEESAVTRFLREIAKVDMSILATIVNQNVILRPPCDMEEIYRRALGPNHPPPVARSRSRRQLAATASRSMVRSPPACSALTMVRRRARPADSLPWRDCRTW